jgi:AraC family transcriptional regulator
MKLARKDESPEFDAFLRGPSIRGASSRELGWRGLVLEEHCAPEGERPLAFLQQHLLVMWRDKTATAECRMEQRHFSTYTHYQGSFKFFPVGPTPACRPRRQVNFLLCAFEPKFVDRICDEMEQPPCGQLCLRDDFRDQTTHQLIRLLRAEIASGGESGRLFADYLVHALTTRVLTLALTEKPSPLSRISGLPRHILERVTERMRDLRADLDLQSLSMEAGYSQRHFLRMFRKATGLTPHQYRMKLRVARAQELLLRKRMSLIDIAYYCGFSSHSHMTMVFRQLLGVTPSELRRDVDYEEGHSLPAEI